LLLRLLHVRCLAATKGKDGKSEAQFTSRTDLLLVPALVTDKSANHITGLQEEDFSLLANGTEQKIVTSRR
jgi:hypothetical protein